MNDAAHAYNLKMILEFSRGLAVQCTLTKNTVTHLYIVTQKSATQRKKNTQARMETLVFVVKIFLEAALVHPVSTILAHRLSGLFM